MVLFASLLLNFGIMGSSELFPLLAARNDTSGLRLAPQEVGVSSLPMGLIVFIMPLLYPCLERSVGSRGVYAVGVTVNCVYILGLPMLRWLPEHSPTKWVLLLVLMGLRGTSGPLIFPSLIVIFNEAIESNAGFWNGLQNSVSSFSRAVAPTIYGYLFAISTAKGHWAFPFDVYLPFLLGAFVLMPSVGLVGCVPKAGAPDQSPRFKSRVRAQPWSWLRRGHRR